MSRPLLFVLALAYVLQSTQSSFAQPKRRSAPTSAAPTPAPSAPSSAEYVEAGERALNEGRYADAAAEFVKADQSERDMALLVRAFEAAHQADDPLLIVQVAERILARPEVSDEGRTLARKAVAKASDRLTQIELVCAERQCAFEIDGEPTPEGISYRMPGVHEIRLSDDPENALQVHCAARAICRFRLPSSEPTLDPLPLIAAQPTGSEPSSAPEAPEAPAPSSRRLRASMAALVGSAVGAATLGTLSIWSGVRAVQAKELHETDRSRYDADEVRTHARRADYFLLGAGVCAAAAVATAIWGIDWDERRSTRLSLQGATGLSATHRF